jgi:spermidine synthase
VTGSFGETVVEGFHYRFDGPLLHEERSAFQLVQVYENPAFGRVLVLDGLTQTSERDEFTYHEMLVHTPMTLHPDPKRVLVIGGGDGGTLRHVLMHPSVERAVMVEIDQTVTDVCRKLMPSIGGTCWDDPRAEVLFDDGIAFTKNTTEQFDVIIIDSSDPVGPGEGLFTPDFYADARRALAPNGILCAQAGGVVFADGEYERAFRNARTAFPEARLALGDVPIYPGTRWSYLIGGVEELPSVATLQERASARNLAARYWTPSLCLGAFGLPAFVEASLNGEPVQTWGDQ